MQQARDLKHLQHAIALADDAAPQGYGAVLVSFATKRLLEGLKAYAVNHGPGHATANQAQDAPRQINAATLPQATPFRSFERCSMCSAITHRADIGSLVPGKSERRFGELRGDDPEHQTQVLDSGIIFASRQRSMPGPFPEREVAIATPHKAFWKTGGVA